MAHIALLGGTGPEGVGLALRCAMAGEQVTIGSRQPERARQAAATVNARLPEAVRRQHPVAGSDNLAAAREAEIIALTLPCAAVTPLLTEMSPALSGKIILDMVNPVAFTGGSFKLLSLAAGSAAELIQQLVPGAQVVSGFKNISAKELGNLDRPLRGDVLLCSDAADAKAFFAALVARIPDLRSVDAGPLANARHLESITALLLNLNRQHRAITSIRILGI